MAQSQFFMAMGKPSFLSKLSLFLRFNIKIRLTFVSNSRIFSPKSSIVLKEQLVYSGKIQLKPGLTSTAKMPTKMSCRQL